MKLEIIYKMPVRLLFPNLFQQLEKKILKLKNAEPQMVKLDWFPAPSEQLKQEEHCFYAELLKTHIPNELEIKTVFKHVLALNNTAHEFTQGQNPFAGQQNAKEKA